MIHGGDEFQMDEIKPVRVMDDQPGAIVPADESREKSLGQSSQHLICRAGIQPPAWEVERGADLVDNAGKRVGKRSGIDQTQFRVHTGEHVHVLGGALHQAECQQGRSTTNHQGLRRGIQLLQTLGGETEGPVEQFW